MKIIYKILALAGLVVTLLPAWLCYSGSMTEQSMKTWVFAGTIIWFIGATPLLGKKKENI